MSTKSIGEEIASMTREFLDTLGKNGIEIPILPQMTEWEKVRLKAVQLEEKNRELREALRNLINASRGFRLSWLNKKSGIGIFHGELEQKEEHARALLE